MKDQIQDTIIFILAALIVFGIGLNYLSPKNTVPSRANVLITHSSTVTSDTVASEPILSETHSSYSEYTWPGVETKGNYRSR